MPADRSSSLLRRAFIAVHQGFHAPNTQAYRWTRSVVWTLIGLSRDINPPNDYAYPDDALLIDLAEKPVLEPPKAG